MADFDAQANMFMVQNLMGSSGSGGSSSGVGGGDVSFLGSLEFPSMEKMPKKVQVPVFKTAENIISAMQGFISSVEISNLGIFSPQMQLPAGVINLNKKIAGVIASKGGQR
jgi:hypothetical protein